jgi:hypothetical protein
MAVAHLYQNQLLSVHTDDAISRAAERAHEAE